MTEEEIKALQEENAKLKEEKETLTKSYDTLKAEKEDFESKYNAELEKSKRAIHDGAPLPDGKTGDELFASLFK